MENNLAVQPQQTAQAPYEGGLDLEELVQLYEDAEQASRDARSSSERCRDYYDSKQLTAEEISELRKRGQPEIIRNKIKHKVNFMLGWEAQTRSDPKAFANTEGGEQAADAVTEMLRFQEQKNNLDQKLSEVWENMVIEGFGGVEVLGPSSRDPRVMDVKLWKWDRLFHDPHSSDHDFEDAMYKGGFIWMDENQALARWPQAKEAIQSTAANSEHSTFARTYDDKPRTYWVTGTRKRKRVRIVQMYYTQDGESWHWCLFTKGGKIDSGPVEFLDKDGKPDCPLKLQSAYVDRENNRYGEVAEFLTVQDGLNKAHSKSLHLLNSHQTVAETGVVTDVNKLKAEKARPDGHIELPIGTMEKNRFQFVEHSAKIAGNMELAQSLEAHIDISGANAALMGTQKGQASGRAIRANQEGGMIELGRIKDRHTHLKKRVYESVWCRCRQFVTEETMIRVTDDEESAKFVGFNRPQTMAEKMAEDARREGIPEEEIVGKLEQADADPMVSQELRQIVGLVNVPAEIDVDIVIEPAEQSINMQEENFQSFMQAFPPGSLPPSVVLELWPGSPKVKRRVKKALEPAPEQVQKTQVVEAMQADNLDADTENKRAQAAKNRAQAGETTVRAIMPPEPKLPEQRSSA